MSAKPAKKHAKTSPASPAPSPTSPVAAAPRELAAKPSEATAAVPLIDSPDPKRRQWGQFALIAVWLYVAALWLLALDQLFGWGIFGPKVTLP